jgi:hypothetical protein
MSSLFEFAITLTQLRHFFSHNFETNVHGKQVRRRPVPGVNLHTKQSFYLKCPDNLDDSIDQGEQPK